MQVILKRDNSEIVAGLSIKGKITRQDGSGSGVVFDSINIDSYFQLKNIVMHNASDSKEIEKEMFSIR